MKGLGSRVLLAGCPLHTQFVSVDTCGPSVCAIPFFQVATLVSKLCTKTLTMPA